MAGRNHPKKVLLVGIDVTKSTGPDEITGRMIQNTAYCITPLSKELERIVHNRLLEEINLR